MIKIVQLQFGLKAQIFVLNTLNKHGTSFNLLSFEEQSDAIHTRRRHNGSSTNLLIAFEIRS